MRRRETVLAAMVLAAVVVPGPRTWAAQDRKVAIPVPSPTVQQVVPGTGIEDDATEKRERLEQVMRKYPPSLARVLKTDPTLMQEPAYIARYPALAAFLAAHPDVIMNPAFYFDHVYLPGEYEPQTAQTVSLRIFQEMIQTASILGVMTFVALVLAWLVRTVINHRRWLRLSRVQDEVHNKLLDRFSGTGELLTYVQTTAGRRFLEAAPIDVEPSGRAVAAPISRMLWSMQAGVVLAIGGIGFQVAAAYTLPEISQGLWLIGILAVAFGVGFLISGVLSYVISKRMGLLDPVVTAEPPPLSERSSA